MAGPAMDEKRAIRPRRRAGRLPAWVKWAVAAALVIALALAAAIFYLTRDTGDDASLPDVPETRPEVTTKLGVFRGTELKGTEAFEAWLGRDVDYIVDFSSRGSWQEISQPEEMVAHWKGSKYRQVYSVGLLPEDPADTIERGATGEYDDYYRKLAQLLVDNNQGDSIIRLGWEFNLEGSRWATDNAPAFIEYWRHIVAAMREIPGQAFEFDWNPNNGKGKYDAVNYYPGNDVVDYIGIDAYDTSWAFNSYPYPNDCDAECRTKRQTVAWNKSIYGGTHGLKFWSKFARSKGKPMSLPEWGMWERDDQHGGGDDPSYLKRMHDFIKDPSNRVAYQAYFEFDGDDGPHRLMTTYPESGKVFRSLFGKP